MNTDRMNQVKVNDEYELYQIITDFEHPLEIFREGIHGEGLARDKLSNLFDLAYSTKVDDNYVALKGMQGYKGHGTKVFFNAQEIKICSKTSKGDYWAASMPDPVVQIETNHDLKYSDPVNPKELDIDLPQDWKQGFRVQIINPRVFSSIENQEQLDHRCLRDYCKWYTIIGTIETLFNDELKEKGIKLYLSGLNMSSFKDKYNNRTICDPIPVYAIENEHEYEVIPLGHDFPPTRDNDTKMEKYVNELGVKGKPAYKYYSKEIYKGTVNAGAISFRLVIYLEGEETERKY